MYSKRQGKSACPILVRLPVKFADRCNDKVETPRKKYEQSYLATRKTLTFAKHSQARNRRAIRQARTRLRAMLVQLGNSYYTKSFESYSFLRNGCLNSPR